MLKFLFKEKPKTKVHYLHVSYLVLTTNRDQCWGNATILYDPRERKSLEDLRRDLREENNRVATSDTPGGRVKWAIDPVFVSMNEISEDLYKDLLPVNSDR